MFTDLNACINFSCSSAVIKPGSEFVMIYLARKTTLSMVHCQSSSIEIKCIYGIKSTEGGNEGQNKNKKLRSTISLLDYGSFNI